METKNTAIWDQVFATNPKHTKEFTRGGGFKGTATNALYLIHKATELWGPIGAAWGPEIVEDKMLQGAPIIVNESVVGHEIIHCVTINLRFPGGSVPAFGQTTFVGKNKYGTFTDEEAPKKSLTDALTKALSWLGFSADIHMGLFDDNKYVNDLRQKFAEQAPAQKMDASLLAGHLTAIASAATEDSLFKLYAAAYRIAKAIDDKGALTLIDAAKDKRKKELTTTTAGAN